MDRFESLSYAPTEANLIKTNVEMICLWQMHKFTARFENIPDMLELDHLTVSGDVTFGKDVTLKVNLRTWFKSAKILVCLRLTNAVNAAFSCILQVLVFQICFIDTCRSKPHQHTGGLYFHGSLLCCNGPSRPVVLNVSWFLAPSPLFNWRIINIVTLGFCNITAELISKSLCSWPPENSFVVPKGPRAPVEKSCSRCFIAVNVKNWLKIRDIS